MCPRLAHLAFTLPRRHAPTFWRRARTVWRGFGSGLVGGVGPCVGNGVGVNVRVVLATLFAPPGGVWLEQLGLAELRVEQRRHMHGVVVPRGFASCPAITVAAFAPSPAPRRRRLPRAGVAATTRGGASPWRAHDAWTASRRSRDGPSFPWLRTLACFASGGTVRVAGVRYVGGRYGRYELRAAAVVQVDRVWLHIPHVGQATVAAIHNGRLPRELKLVVGGVHRCCHRPCTFRCVF